MNTYKNYEVRESRICSWKSRMVTIWSSPSWAQLGQTAVFTRLNRGGMGTGVEQMRQGRWPLFAGAFSIN